MTRTGIEDICACTPLAQQTSLPASVQRHLQKYGAQSCAHEDDSEDNYLSFLRGVRDTGNDDDAGSDGKDLDASNDDEELDEKATLVEVPSSSYSNPSSPHSTRIFLIRGLTAHTERTSFRRSGARLRTLHTAYVRMLS